MKFHDRKPVDVVKDTTEAYLDYSWKKNLFLISMAVLLVALSFFTIRLGATGLTYGEIIHYIFHPDNSWNSSVVWDMRLPRIVAAILAGCALGTAGAVMQGILRNPLASPFTLGISNAAAFGAALAIMFFGGGLFVRNNMDFDVSEPVLVTVCAFAFALLATGVVLLLVKVTECTPESIVLAGMAISAIFSAGLALFQYIADDTALSAIVFWQFGSLDKANWDNLKLMFIVIVPILAYFFWKRWDYNAMEAGEDVAMGLGINIRSTRFIGLVCAAMMTAIVVSFMGIIGFIGLIGPHMVKRMIGNDFRYLLAGSMLMGSLVLMISYAVGSYALSESIPVGIVTSAIGGPVFIYILVRGYRKRCSV